MVDKSAFSSEDSFVEFAEKPAEERRKILKGTEEVDQILDEVKEKATANKKKKEKDACKVKKNSQAKL